MSLILTILKLSGAHLVRDRGALALTFILPLIFFTVFASVFSDMDGASEKPLLVALEVQSSGVFTDQLVSNLRDNTLLEVTTGSSGRQVKQLIARSRVDAVIVLPETFEEQIEEGVTARVILLVDGSNPLTGPAVSGHLMQAVIDAAGLLSGDSSELVEPLRIELQDVIGDGKQASIAFFAAGLGVLFLMLSMTNRAGMILEERESGVLARMLCTQLTLSHFLIGRAVFFTLLGMLQITVMFAWASVIFDLDLMNHIGSFAVMATVSATSAAAFGLAIVMLCRTRERLTAVSTIVVLLLAAIGGNLFPRFLMPEWLEQMGWLTFNAWAVDGFQQIFWYDMPLTALTRHIGILVISTVAFLVLARLMAVRWLK